MAKLIRSVGRRSGRLALFGAFACAGFLIAGSADKEPPSSLTVPDRIPHPASSVAPAGVTPFLMFEGQGQQAMEFYTRVLPDSAILNVVRYGPEGPGPENTIMIASMSLRGQTVLVSDGNISHDFTFTPSFSLFVTCDDEAEIDRLTAELGEDGKTLMPLDNYGFSQRFAWVEDRFGVSWQLNLP